MVHHIFVELWPAVALAVDIAAAIGVTIHAVLRKRRVPSIVGWLGLVWLAPILGSLLYLCFGINRIERSGVASQLRAVWASVGAAGAGTDERAALEEVASRYPTLSGLARLGGRVTGNPLVGGNRVEPLVDGDAAYPAMLQAIERAAKSVTLLSYIFDNDAAGDMFLRALQGAGKRGVQVRVLIDAIGARYTRPTMIERLRKTDIPVAAFLPTRWGNLVRYANLRNHRKILVVDGAVGFTGGMNIREGHWLSRHPADPVRCLHFRIDGPVVADLQRTFAVDWAFASGERLSGEEWFPSLGTCGPVAARGVPDGPDADLDNMVHVIHGALASACRRVRIVTPYFLPDETLLPALNVAALRGIQVDIVLPWKTNISLLDWATRPQLSGLLGRGCRIHFSPAPFDHTKLLIVDGCWALIGSTNWDARSLRLNFEYNLECYDTMLAGRLEELVEARIAQARQVHFSEMLEVPLAIRLRDGLARLLSPYL